MAGAILQLKGLGEQDASLTQNPEINLFHQKQYRYVNFSTEIARLTLEGVADFGKATSCIIPKRGHLLSKMYMRISLPNLVLESGTYLAWSDAIGYSIFEGGIDLEIGGVVVETIYPQFEDIYQSFNALDSDQGRNLMINKSDNYLSTRTNATVPVDVIVPLNFWFTRDYVHALPVICLSSQEVRVKFKFRPFQDCVHYDGDVPIEYNVGSAEVFAEYINLDSSVLDKFVSDTHTFIVSQVKFHGEERVNPNSKTFSTQLHFTNPCKELFFACVDNQSKITNGYFNYSNSQTRGPLVSEIGLFIDNIPRFDYIPENFSRFAYASTLHKNVPVKHVYTIPFGLRTGTTQPTGSLNMSAFDNVTLSLKMQPGNPECFLYVYAVTLNKIVIKDGSMSFEWGV